MTRELAHAAEDFAARYYLELACAFVRGRLGEEALRERGSLEISLDPRAEQERIFLLGRQAGLKLHRFKRTMGLPRVARVLGILRSARPENLLDVGSGRGAFLWPLLDAFPGLPITAVDLDERRVSDMVTQIVVTAKQAVEKLQLF